MINVLAHALPDGTVVQPLAYSDDYGHVHTHAKGDECTWRTVNGHPVCIKGKIRSDLSNLLQEKGGRVVLFHGTTNEVVDKIKKEGLRVGDRKWEGMFGGRRKNAVFVTATFSSARFYAHNAEGVAADAGFAKARAIIVELRVPREEFTKFHKDERDPFNPSFFREGGIPREWVKGFHNPEKQAKKHVALTEEDDVPLFLVVLASDGREVHQTYSIKKPLYVCRPIANAEEIREWFKEQGIETLLPPEDMHVTVCYSKESMDWDAAGADAEQMKVVGGVRSVEPLGDEGAVVMKFVSDDLQRRHEEFKEVGASWDYDGYFPHVTLTYALPESVRLSAVQPFPGVIVLGPERFGEIEEGWADDIEEYAETRWKPSPHDGVWRTIRGRRVWIRHGETLKSALERSLRFEGKAITDEDVDVALSDFVNRASEVDPNVLLRMSTRHTASWDQGLAEKTVRALDTAFERRGQVLKSDAIFYRGLGVVRVEKGVLTDVGFMTIARKESIAARFTGNTLLELTVPAGEKVVRLPDTAKVPGIHKGLKREPQAFLLDRGTSIEITRLIPDQDLSGNKYIRAIARVRSDPKKKDFVELDPENEQVKVYSQIDYKQIESHLDELEAQALNSLRPLLQQQRDALIATVKRHKDDFHGLARSLKLSRIAQVREAVRDMVSSAMERGQQDARGEIEHVREFHTPGGHGHDQQKHAGHAFYGTLVPYGKAKIPIGRKKEFEQHDYAEWNEEDHPRVPKGSEKGGEFAPKEIQSGIGWDAARMSSAREQVRKRLEELEQSGDDSQSNPEFDSLSHIATVLDRDEKAPLSQRRNLRSIYTFTADGKLVAAADVVRRSKTTAEILNVGSIQKGAGSAVVRETVETVQRHWPQVRRVELVSMARPFFERLGFRLESRSTMVRDLSVLVEQHDYASKPLTPKGAISWMLTKVFWVTDLLTDGITESARGVIINAIRNGEPVSETVEKLWGLFEPFIGDPDILTDGEPLSPHRLETIIRTNTTESYNMGRLSEYVRDDILPFLQGIRYSAIIDSRTTEVCRFLHEKIFPDPESPDLASLVPPNHFSCRSIVVPVVVGEKVDASDFITPAQIAKARSLADAKFLEQEGELKEFYDPDQPRVPKGSEKGGEFAPKGEGPVEILALQAPDMDPVEAAEVAQQIWDVPPPPITTDREMRSVINGYQGNGYYGVNSFLRGQKLDVENEEAAKRMVRILDRATKAHEAPVDFTVFRGVGIRGKWVEGLREGDIIEDKAFMSTTLTRQVAKEFGSKQVEIRVPKGTKFLSVSSLAKRTLPEGVRIPDMAEAEVLFPRGTRLRVDKAPFGDRVQMTILES